MADHSRHEMDVRGRVRTTCTVLPRLCDGGKIALAACDLGRALREGGFGTDRGSKAAEKHGCRTRDVWWSAHSLDLTWRRRNGSGHSSPTIHITTWMPGGK